eukprot:snap_masked-scaffold_6-processed-gene-4.51-mRNA-1 protein AED:1.00 eAED:1.00 QI:0/-1/0/0/-1/1/1/0/341
MDRTEFKVIVDCPFPYVILGVSHSSVDSIVKIMFRKKNIVYLRYLVSSKTIEIMRNGYKTKSTGVWIPSGNNPENSDFFYAFLNITKPSQLEGVRNSAILQSSQYVILRGLKLTKVFILFLKQAIFQKKSNFSHLTLSFLEWSSNADLRNLFTHIAKNNPSVKHLFLDTMKSSEKNLCWSIPMIDFSSRLEEFKFILSKEIWNGLRYVQLKNSYSKLKALTITLRYFSVEGELSFFLNLCEADLKSLTKVAIFASHNIYTVDYTAYGIIKLIQPCRINFWVSRLYFSRIPFCLPMYSLLGTRCCAGLNDNCYAEIRSFEPRKDGQLIERLRNIAERYKKET